MLKNIFITVLFLFSVSSFAQDEFDDPGFGDEGGGDAADAPGEAVPIDGVLYPLLITGLLTAIYYVNKKERQLKQN
jgi:hypothetical protein